MQYNYDYDARNYKNSNTIQDRLEYAERRLEEEIKNGEMRDIQYWRGYRDAVNRMMEEQDGKIKSCPKCGSYSLHYMKICNNTVPLVECVVCGWNSILSKEEAMKNRY